MAIWQKPAVLETIQSWCKNTMDEHIDIRVTEIGDDYIVGTMPVDHKTKQPMGLLHGGASVVLAESLGSIGANLCVDNDHYCVGLEINANHISSARSGRVTATAKPLHIGGKTQVWDIQSRDESDELVCIARLTMAVLARR